MVVPVEEKKVLIRRAFAAITKEFLSTGVAVVVDHACGPDEALLGFRWRGIAWVRAKAKQSAPHGGGFYEVGFRMTERLERAIIRSWRSSYSDALRVIMRNLDATLPRVTPILTRLPDA